MPIHTLWFSTALPSWVGPSGKPLAFRTRHVIAVTGFAVSCCTTDSPTAPPSKSYIRIRSESRTRTRVKSLTTTHPSNFPAGVFHAEPQ